MFLKYIKRSLSIVAMAYGLGTNPAVAFDLADCPSAFKIPRRQEKIVLGLMEAIHGHHPDWNDENPASLARWREIFASYQESGDLETIYRQASPRQKIFIQGAAIRSGFDAEDPLMVKDLARSAYVKTLTYWERIENALARDLTIKEFGAVLVNRHAAAEAPAALKKEGFSPAEITLIQAVPY